MIMRLTIRAAAPIAGAAIVAIGVAAPAGADDQFGEHVRNCAQTTGFDVGHNPGIHQGYAGWSPDHTC